MKNKIALCGDAEKRKQMEGVLSKCLEKNDIPFKIHHVSDSQQFVSSFLLENDFRLFMMSAKGTISYMLKIYNNFDQQSSCYIPGTLKFPLTQVEFTKHMLEVFKLSHVCPYGAYAAKNAKMSRIILHEDIQFIYKKKRKSVIFLYNGESVEVTSSHAQILKELDSNYFAKCSKGFIVNFFSIEQISDDYKTLLMKSGAIIPMSMLGRKQLFKTLSLSITGINVFNY